MGLPVLVPRLGPWRVIPHLCWELLTWLRSSFSLCIFDKRINSHATSAAKLSPTGHGVTYFRCSQQTELRQYCALPLKYPAFGIREHKFNKQPSKLSELQNTQIIYLQRLSSPCLASSYRRWKCKKGKRLTITANFQERNLGTALSGKKIRPVGRIVKSWTGYERVISQSDSRT